MRISPQIRTELLKRFPNSVAEIDAYIRWMKDAPVVPTAKMFYCAVHRHHMLPRGWFPQFADFKLYPWNCRFLYAEDHHQAHRWLNSVGYQRLSLEKPRRPKDVHIFIAKDHWAAVNVLAQTREITRNELVRRLIAAELSRATKTVKRVG